MSDQQEVQRQRLQRVLDGSRTSAERNRLGQFATPGGLAREIVAATLPWLGDGPLRFLEPAFGTGVFYSALREAVGPSRIATALGYELDPHYGVGAQQLWADGPLQLKIESFLEAPPPRTPGEQFDLLLANPPYVRHHHLTVEEKRGLRRLALAETGLRPSGLSGLYVYFLLLAHPWLAPGGLGVWLLPGEVLDVNYGRPLRQYLLRQVTLLRVHRWDPADRQFEDALVGSAVLWLRQTPPPVDHRAEFTAGGTLTVPALRQAIPLAELAQERKWTRYFRLGGSQPNPADGPRLGDWFEIRRGIATGDNRFFILDEAQIRALGLSGKYLRPILPGPRHLRTDVVEADAEGDPLVEPRRWLLDCPLPEERLDEAEPALRRYLAAGRARVAGRYLCSRRRPWYRQEQRPPAPLLCTYLGRGPAGASPFRFLRNHSRALAANVYLLLLPRPPLAAAAARRPGLYDAVWEWLKQLPPEALQGEGRGYGGGLYKLEPAELAAVPADGLGELLAGLPEEGGEQLALL